MSCVRCDGSGVILRIRPRLYPASSVILPKMREFGTWRSVVWIVSYPNCPHCLGRGQVEFGVAG